MSIEGGYFVWLLWKNFELENLCSTCRQRRPCGAPARKEDCEAPAGKEDCEAQAGKEDPAELFSCLFLALAAIVFSRLEPF